MRLGTVLVSLLSAKLSGAGSVAACVSGHGVRASSHKAIITAVVTSSSSMHLCNDPSIDVPPRNWLVIVSISAEVLATVAREVRLGMPRARRKSVISRLAPRPCATASRSDSMFRDGGVRD